MAAIFGFDAYSPREIAERVENVGVTKARLPLLSMLALGVLAGGFVALGSVGFTVVVSDPALSFAMGRVLGGVVFSLGLILVVVAGAELFTGNNLLVMAWVAGRVSTRQLLRNFAVVYAANCAGAMGLALLVSWSGHWKMADGAVGRAAVEIAGAKTALSFGEAFFRGILCNVLVCLAVWLAVAGRNVADKVLAIVFPITVFVAAGFEHCVANMYLIPLGIMLRNQGVDSVSSGGDQLDWSGFAHNLFPVTLGNIVGGSVMVGLVYFTIYRLGVAAEKRQVRPIEIQRVATSTSAPRISAGLPHVH